MVGQAVVSGVLAGALYALVALGLGLVFGVMRVLNLAHGPLLMLGAYAAWALVALAGLHPLLALVAVLPLTFGLGVALERLFLRRLAGRPELASLLLTFGLGIALVSLVQLAFSSDLRAVDYLGGSVLLGPLAVSRARLAAAALAAALAGAVGWMLAATRPGKALRAIAQNREMAQLCGVDVGRIDMLAFGLGAALAGAGGALLALVVAIQPEMGQIYTVKAFLVVVLAGAGSYPGVLLGGVLLGVLEQLAGLVLTVQVTEAVAYALVVLALLARPTGLLGGRPS